MTTDPDQTAVVQTALEQASSVSVDDPTNDNFTGLAHGQDTNSGTAAAEIVLNGGNSLTIPDGSSLRVKALGNNASVAYIGEAGSTTDANGYELSADDDVLLDVTDVSNVSAYLAAGEGVSWIVEQ